MRPHNRREGVSGNQQKLASQPQKISSSQLLKNGKQIIIEHMGEDYVLRITSQGKLILTK